MPHFKKESTTSGVDALPEPRLRTLTKSIALVAVICLLMTSLFACNGSQNDGPNNGGPGQGANGGDSVTLNGTYDWIGINSSAQRYTVSYIFTSDGKVTYEIYTTPDAKDVKTGTYVIENGRITFTFTGEQPESASITIKDDYIMLKGLQYDKK